MTGILMLEHDTCKLYCCATENLHEIELRGIHSIKTSLISELWRPELWPCQLILLWVRSTSNCTGETILHYEGAQNGSSFTWQLPKSPLVQPPQVKRTKHSWYARGFGKRGDSDTFLWSWSSSKIWLTWSVYDILCWFGEHPTSQEKPSFWSSVVKQFKRKTCPATKAPAKKKNSNQQPNHRSHKYKLVQIWVSWGQRLLWHLGF